VDQKELPMAFLFLEAVAAENVMAFFNETQTSKAKRIEVC